MGEGHGALHQQGSRLCGEQNLGRHELGDPHSWYAHGPFQLCRSLLYGQVQLEHFNIKKFKNMILYAVLLATAFAVPIGGTTCDMSDETSKNSQGNLGLTSFVPTYSSDDVDIATFPFKGRSYHVVTLSRANQRVKAKYFACQDANRSVYDRFLEWSRGKSIILVSSGTYMDSSDPNTVEGLTIDNGRLVNERPTDMDALVVVYATGGIVVSNLDGDPINMLCGGTNQAFDIRKSFERQRFIACSEAMDATVFQTHLLVYEDKMQIYQSSSPTARERRFLAACKYDGVVYHVIVSVDEYVSLLEATQNVYAFLTEGKEFDEVVYMINLDTGMQNVYTVFDPAGRPMDSPKGNTPPQNAVNLLVYYYE